jgi:hypothetical protein
VTLETRRALWQQFAHAGLVTGDMPAPAEPAAPWFVRIMLGIAGWIGAVFLLGFVGAGFAVVFRNEQVALVIGALCCAGAWGVFTAAPRNVLAGQFGLAVSLAGQVMFIFGLNETTGLDVRSPGLFFVVAIFEGALAFLLPNFVHRVLSTAAMAVAAGYGVNAMALYGMSTPLVGAALAAVWLTTGLWAGRGGFWRAIGWGLVLGFIQPVPFVGALMFFVNGGPRPPAYWLPWVNAALIVAVLVYVVRRLLDRAGSPVSSTPRLAALAGSALVGAACYRAPGITAGLMVMLLGFSNGSRELLGAGIVALLSYLAYFYYSLAMTLLWKSVVLAGTGAALMLLWLVIRKWLAPDQVEGGHA